MCCACVKGMETVGFCNKYWEAPEAAARPGRSNPSDAKLWVYKAGEEGQAAKQRPADFHSVRCVKVDVSTERCLKWSLYINSSRLKTTHPTVQILKSYKHKRWSQFFPCPEFDVITTGGSRTGRGDRVFMKHLLCARPQSSGPPSPGLVFPVPTQL